MAKIYSYFLLAIFILTLIFASKFALSAPKESSPFTIQLSLDLAGPTDESAAPPLRPSQLKIFLRQKGFSFKTSRSFDPESTARYSMTLNSENSKIQNRSLSFPLTEETISNIFIKITDSKFFFEKQINVLALLQTKNLCVINETKTSATCDLHIPTVELENKTLKDEKNKKIEIKIFKKSYLPTGNLNFLPIDNPTPEKIVDYLQIHTRPDLDNKQSDGKHLLEMDQILYGYFQIDEFSLSDSTQDSKRIPLLPGLFRIEKIVTKEDGSFEQKFVIVDLQDWGKYIPASELNSQWKNF